MMRRIRSFLQRPLTGLSANKQYQTSLSVRMLKLRQEAEPGGLEERIHCRAWKKGLSSPVLLVGRKAPTHAVLVGSETTGPQRSTIESAEWSHMYTPHHAVPCALDTEPAQ